MDSESNKYVFLIQIDALRLAKFDISEFEISRVNCTVFYQHTGVWCNLVHFSINKVIVDYMIFNLLLLLCPKGTLNVHINLN